MALFVQAFGRTIQLNLIGSPSTTQFLRFHFSSLQSDKLKLFQQRPVSGHFPPRAVMRFVNRGPSHRNLTVSKSSSVPIPTDYKKPSQDQIRTSPIARKFCEMTNEELLPYAARDDPDACAERLIREIMAVDNIDWDEAYSKMQVIQKSNKAFATDIPLLGYVASSPYAVGIVTSMTAGFASIPLVFNLEVAKVFNERYVTADVADDKDLETWLEVGSWTWSWMEPVLGQVSFLLLCFQFARNQMINLKWRPYSHAVRNVRSRRLQRRFPAYNAMILHQFSVTDSWF